MPFQGDPNLVPWTVKVRDWFQIAHLNFHRVYPWILFAPYVVWLSSWCQVGRGSFTSRAALHILGCGLFLAGSWAINSHASATVTRVILVTSTQESAAEGFKSVQVQVRNEGTPTRVSEEVVHVFRPEASTSALPSLTVTGRFAGIPTNLVPKLEAALKPLPPPDVFVMRPLSMFFDLLAFGAIASVTHAVHFHRRLRERERRALWLESSLAKSQLHALQAQLQPHFLFNTLNAIATLLRRDPKAAEATLTSLSDLLRLSLGQLARQEIPLSEELRFLDRYMEIQQTRFGDRLNFEKSIETPAEKCFVPTLVLQPIVENSVRHGIEPSSSPGRIRVVARVEGDRLLLAVEDDGVGLVANAARDCTEGIGLGNLRSRLQALYGSAQSLNISPRAGGGVEVRIAMPVRFEDGAVGTGAVP